MSPPGNQSKYSLIDKKKHSITVKDSITFTIKLARDKEWLAVTEYSESYSECDQSAYQVTSAVASNFNHPSKNYVNYISIDLSAQVMSPQNDVKKKTKVDR